jgi:hypothetical protein
MKFGMTCGDGEGALGVDVFCMTFIIDGGGACCCCTICGGGVGDADLVMIVGFCLI